MGRNTPIDRMTYRQKRTLNRALLPFGWAASSVVGDLLSVFVAICLVYLAGKLALTYWYITAAIILLWVIHRVDNWRRASKRQSRKRTAR